MVPTMTMVLVQQPNAKVVAPQWLHVPGPTLVVGAEAVQTNYEAVEPLVAQLR